MRIWISGGTARLPGLAARIGELIGTPTLLFDPLEKTRPAHGSTSGAPGPQYAQALGLALRTA